MPETTSRPSPDVSRAESGSASNPPHVPLLSLDREGTIQRMTKSARTALEYAPDESVESCFFSHVHGRNLRRVMRDLALMVSHRKQRARWLLRLRTGSGRWKWYRAIAHNNLDQPEETVQVRLRPL